MGESISIGPMSKPPETLLATANAITAKYFAPLLADVFKPTPLWERWSNQLPMERYVTEWNPYEPPKKADGSIDFDRAGL